MKKITKCSLLGVLFCLSLGGLVLAASRNNFKTAKADGSWSETLTPSDLIVDYAVAFDDDSSVNSVDSKSGKYSYFTRHGNLQKSKIAKFDNVTIINLESTGDKVKFTSSTATDCWMTNRKINMNGGKTGDNTDDGGILGITAKEPLAISFEIDAVAGWLNGGSINWYLQKSGSSSYTQVDTSKDPAKGTRVASDVINLKAGDTFYWEFIQYYGGGNIEKLPTFTMESVSTVIDRTVTSTEVANSYYNDALVGDSTADYAVDISEAFGYGVRHGNIANGTLEKFDTISNTGGNLQYAQSVDGANRAGISYGRNLWTLNNDGVIVFFHALTELTFSAPSITYAGGWLDSIYVSYFLKKNGSSSYEKIAYYLHKGVTNPSVELKPLLLEAGDEIYFELRSAATSGDRRSIQDNSITGNVPTFVLKNGNVGENTVIANTFEYRYMKFADVATTDLGTGKCISSGWYAAAKTAFNNLDASVRELIMTNTAYTDTANRLTAWATANGEIIDASYSITTSSSNTIMTIKNNNSLPLVILFASIISITAFAFVLVIKKRKHN